MINVTEALDYIDEIVQFPQSTLFGKHFNVRVTNVMGIKDFAARMSRDLMITNMVLTRNMIEFSSKSDEGYYKLSLNKSSINYYVSYILEEHVSSIGKDCDLQKLVKLWVIKAKPTSSRYNQPYKYFCVLVTTVYVDAPSVSDISKDAHGIFETDGMRILNDMKSTYVKRVTNLVSESWTLYENELIDEVSSTIRTAFVIDSFPELITLLNKVSS